MFNKKTKPETKNEKATNSENQKEKTSNTLQSWVTGKIGSFILFTAVGYGLYKFGVIPKIINYFTKKPEPKQEPILG